MMRWYTSVNVFHNCELRQLKELYIEFQKYKLLSEITPESPLYKYKLLFLQVSASQSFERFYLMFLKMYSDNLHKYYEKKELIK